MSKKTQIFLIVISVTFGFVTSNATDSIKSISSTDINSKAITTNFADLLAEKNETH